MSAENALDASPRGPLDGDAAARDGTGAHRQADLVEVLVLGNARGIAAQEVILRAEGAAEERIRGDVGSLPNESGRNIVPPDVAEYVAAAEGAARRRVDAERGRDVEGDDEALERQDRAPLRVHGGGCGAVPGDRARRYQSRVARRLA